MTVHKITVKMHVCCRQERSNQKSQFIEWSPVLVLNQYTCNMSLYKLCLAKLISFRLTRKKRNNANLMGGTARCAHMSAATFDWLLTLPWTLCTVHPSIYHVRIFCHITNKLRVNTISASFNMLFYWLCANCDQIVSTESSWSWERILSLPVLRHCIINNNLTTHSYLSYHIYVLLL